MSPQLRQYDFYLEDMLASMIRIEEYTGELNFIQFKQTQIVVDAVVRNFERIGEAAKNVPDDFTNMYPQIPWKKMCGLRNLISHEYFGIDHELI